MSLKNTYAILSNLLCRLRVGDGARVGLEVGGGGEAGDGATGLEVW